ncbi:mitochondrial protein [Drechmeria coniospora]|uniref:MICOS complex subunit n=1 Tax=Drechmeria coniospora TaxID=98403 RepID=A0A151GMH0_DRECN|nr:mitochondrial protein [Drechmeria coniospora]KYK58268.1 mitochondrial protein [Drechmeria coniospora]
MASSVLLKQRSLASLATVALAGIALAPATVLAEAPTDRRRPIYDDVDLSSSPAPVSGVPSDAMLPPPPPTRTDDEMPKQRGPTPTERLAVHIGKARLILYKFAVSAEDKVNETMDSAFHLEQSFTNTIASLAPPRQSGERLMPGAVYVLVAAMAGSIITRKRNILLRATLPLALGIGAGWTVLPITMRNISDLAWTYEQRFPVLAESHVRIREGLKRGVSFAKVHKEVGARYVDEKVTDAREIVESWVKQGK